MLNTYFFLQNSCKTQTKRSSTSSLQAVVCCQNVPPLKVVVFANTHLLLSASGAVCWRCGRRRRPRRLQNLLSTSPWRRRRSRSCWTDVRALQRPWKHKNDVIFKFPSFFFIFRHFNTVDSKTIWIIADDWIQTEDLWNWKRPLYQLSHNHCPKMMFFIHSTSRMNEWEAVGGRQN